MTEKEYWEIISKKIEMTLKIVLNMSKELAMIRHMLAQKDESIDCVEYCPECKKNKSC